jgi:hypothetical protein
MAAILPSSRGHIYFYELQFARLLLDLRDKGSFAPARADAAGIRRH